MNHNPDDPRWHVLYCITKKPELVKSEWIDPEWMRSKSLGTLVDFINRQESIGDMDYIEMRSRLDATHPSLLPREVWDWIITGDVVISGLHSWTRALKRQYFRERTKAKAIDYAKDPSDERLDDLMQVAQDSTANDGDVREVTMADLAAEMDERLDHHVDDGVKTLVPIDTVFGGGLMPGRLITVGARPGVGKSAFAINLILQALSHQPEMTIDLFSLEMTNEQNYSRLISSYLGIAGRSMLDPDMLQAKQKDDVRTAGTVLSGYDLRLWDKVTTLQQIEKVIRQRSAAAKDKYLAVVDYLGLITVPHQPDRRLQIEQITRELKVMTNELNIPILLLSQLSRNIEQRQSTRPMLSDLRESGSIEQDSNAVGFLYNEDRSQTHEKIRSVIFSVQKNREGSLQDIRMTFEADKMRFGVAYG
ncbi:DnaB-like helicase C-terminal domain-containing protein [Lacticaseibacillus baoqingensis]|uniref:DnaB-like helicase C-terminal domain-containing protein n=1 Tax=Lacticaseibacillus baoqingensis TaxID=2486013 RepID=A0ABW4E7W8_9LACO|nr:DnaB-like helicase C-terminal domain-containing protein [Lacticaseibacillus baoqingensis]